MQTTKERIKNQIVKLNQKIQKEKQLVNFYELLLKVLDDNEILFKNKIGNNEIIPTLKKKYHRYNSVLQFDGNGNFIAKYNTIKAASLKTGISYKNIHAALKHYNNTAGGYFWKYER